MVKPHIVLYFRHIVEHNKTIAVIDHTHTVVQHYIM